ncbi:helix-turn-helix domain-containing protein [Aromatoleum evansii]|uniref:helix-turn-helix domain-containing protein n=2 Tax=Aromatoleum evansii TaxID=59406 RepID=UPI00145D5364|nr:helix-turn-helix transcriptional regulator [Aromatoleum evansii]NMG30628.1 helix-turn-helix domain-containing protein [Aromatoleum evansii]
MHMTMFLGETAACTASAGSTSIFVISNQASDATAAAPMRPGWREVRDVLQEREADPARRQQLANARKRLAHVLSERGSVTFLRLEMGLSRRALAALSSIPEAELSRLEGGAETDPRLSVCCRLAQALDRSLAEIAAAIEVSGRNSRDLMRTW